MQEFDGQDQESVEVGKLLGVDYALVGDKEQALAGLEKPFEARDFLLPFVNTDPVFDELCSEPRFQAIIHRMGFGL